MWFKKNFFYFSFSFNKKSSTFFMYVLVYRSYIRQSVHDRLFEECEVYSETPCTPPARYTQYYHIEKLGNTLTLGLNTVREIYRYIDLGLRVYFQTCRDFFWAFKKIWCYWKFKLQRYLNIERWGRYNCKNRNIFKNIFAKKNLFLLFLSNLNVNPNVFQNGKNLLF